MGVNHGKVDVTNIQKTKTLENTEGAIKNGPSGQRRIYIVYLGETNIYTNYAPK